LRAIASYQPKAIFFDAHFTSKREDASISSLRRTLCDLHARKIPLYLAVAPSGEGTATSPLRPEIDAVAGKCFEKVAAHYAPDSIDRLAWTYPMEPAEVAGAPPVPTNTAARALYEFVRKTKLPSDYAEMAITWGLNSAEHTLPWGVRNKDTKAVESYCRDAHGLLEILPPGLKKLVFNEAEKPVCVYHDTLSAGDLIPSSVEENDALSKQLAGKIVMVGADVLASPDLVVSPIHGPIPGVYLHAMALDNLLTYGTDYRRAIGFEFSLDADHLKLDFFLILSLVLVTFVPRKLRQLYLATHPKTPLRDPAGSLAAWAAAGRPEWQRFTRVLAEVLVTAVKIAFCAVLACLLLELAQRVFHFGIMAIMNVIFFTLVADWFEFKDRALSGLLSKSKGGQGGGLTDHAISTRSTDETTD
jgi:hypothetical protein